MKKLKKTFIALTAVATLVGGSMAWAAAPDKAVVSSTGQWLTEVNLFAGTGEYFDENGSARNSNFRTPQSIAVLPDQSIVVADSANHLIRKISDGKVSNYAGVTFELNEKGMPIGGLADGIAEETVFNSPGGITADKAGNVYVADTGNNAIRKISATGGVTTIAGNGIIGTGDGWGLAVQFNHPQAIVVTENGTLYVADTLNHSIRKITSTGTVSTLNALSARVVEVLPGIVETSGDFKDGKLSEALFNEPTGLALDAKGNLFVSDSGNQRIRYIDFAAGTVTTVAGSGLAEDGIALYEEDELYVQGDYADGNAAEALFNFPRGIAVTEDGGLLIADSMNHSIRYLQNGIVSTVAGDANIANGKTNGTDRSARFHRPTDVVLMGDGSMRVADSYNNQIRKIVSYRLPLDLPEGKQIKIVYNRDVIEFDDAQPEFANERTMVPARVIAEAVGYTVSYVENEQGVVETVQLLNGDISIELKIGEQSITRKAGDNVTRHAIDVAPYIKDDRTYVPVRFFAEEIGLDVQWIAEEWTVVIRDKVPTTN